MSYQDPFAPERTVRLTQAEYDQIIDQRYLQRWANHINFNRQVGLGVVLEHPQRELRNIHRIRRLAATIQVQS